MPLVAMCGAIIWKEYQGLTQTALRATSFHDAIAIRSLVQWISTQQNELVALSVLPEIRRGELAASKQVLCALARTGPDWQALGLVDADGTTIATSSGSIRTKQAVRPMSFFRAAVATKKPQVSGYVICPLTGKPAIMMGVPVLRNGAVSTVLVASIKPDSLLKLFGGLGESHCSVICVVDRDNRVLARTLDNERWLGHDFSQARTVTAARKSRQG